MKSQCPSCQRLYEVTTQHLGQVKRCQACGRAFIIEAFERPITKGNRKLVKKSSAFSMEQNSAKLAMPSIEREPIAEVESKIIPAPLQFRPRFTAEQQQDSDIVDNWLLGEDLYWENRQLRAGVGQSSAGQGISASTAKGIEKRAATTKSPQPTLINILGAEGKSEPNSKRTNFFSFAPMSDDKGAPVFVPSPRQHRSSRKLLLGALLGGIALGCGLMWLGSQLNSKSTLNKAAASLSNTLPEAVAAASVSADFTAEPHRASTLVAALRADLRQVRDLLRHP